MGELQRAAVEMDARRDDMRRIANKYRAGAVHEPETVLSEKAQSENGGDTSIHQSKSVDTDYWRVPLPRVELEPVGGVENVDPDFWRLPLPAQELEPLQEEPRPAKK